MTVEISATVSGSDRNVKCTYDFGADLNEAIELFGEDVVLSGFKANAVVAAQSLMRTGIKDELSDADIQKKLDGWRPGVRKPVKSKAEKVREQFEAMSAEEKAALIAELQGGGAKPKK